ADARLRQVEGTVGAARLDVLTMAAAAAQASDAHDRCEAEARACRAELDSVEARIAAVSTHADPSAERAALAADVAALHASHDAARSALAHVQQDLSAARAQL